MTPNNDEPGNIAFPCFIIATAGVSAEDALLIVQSGSVSRQRICELEMRKREMGWFFENITLQQLIAERTQEQTSTGPDGNVYKDICLAHAYVADSETFGVLWCVYERRNSQPLEIVERRIVCYLIEFCNGMLGCKSLRETDYPSYSSVPLSYFPMVPIEVYGGDAQWREAVLHEKSCDETQHRPGLVQMLDAAAKGDVEVLLCSDLTRLTRSLSLEIIGAMQKAGVQIVTTEGTQIGFADLVAHTLINQMPKTVQEDQSQRIKRGILASKLGGKRMPSSPQK